MLQKKKWIFFVIIKWFLESITITLEVQGLFMLSHSQLIANLVMFNLLRYCHVENEVMWFDPYSFMHDIITIMNECCSYLLVIRVLLWWWKVIFLSFPYCNESHNKINQKKFKINIISYDESFAQVLFISISKNNEIICQWINSATSC